LIGDKELRSVVSVVARCAAAASALFIAPFYSIWTWAAVLDPDIWWHIRTGDWIFAHHTVPRDAIFSQHIERLWIAYAWLFDLIVSGAQHRFGLPGLPGLLICLQVVVSLTFLLAMRYFARSFWGSWLIAALCIYAFYVNPLRSVLFTLLFFTIELWLIFEAERTGNDKLLFWTVPVFVLWANFHLQFIHGLFVLGLYVGTRLVSFAARKWLGDVRHTSPALLLGALAAAFAATFVGPNWVYPYRIGFITARNIGRFDFNQEMQAMSFRRPEHYVELLLLIAACYVIGRYRPRDLFRPLLLLVTAFVAFRSLRDAWFVSMAAGFILAEAVGERQQVSEESGGRWGNPLQTAANYAVAAVLALIVSFALAIHQGMSTMALATVMDRMYPIRATDFIRGAHLPGPMYNTYNWGGFLMFNLREYPVSIDPRGDAYGYEIVLRANNTANAIGWQDDPDLARANFVLMERYIPLASVLESDPHFRRVYQDHIAVIFVREKSR
jgi:hypothetical protein